MPVGCEGAVWPGVTNGVYLLGVIDNLTLTASAAVTKRNNIAGNVFHGRHGMPGAHFPPEASCLQREKGVCVALVRPYLALCVQE